LIHAHDLWSNVIGFAAARLARIPIIISRRDLADFRPPRERRLLRLVGRIADATIVNATAIGELAKREGTPAAAIEWVPNGIDVASFDSAASAPLAAPLPPRSVGTTRAVVIGNMDRPHKGHAEIINAAAVLRDHRIDWLFLSDGPLRGSFEVLARDRGVRDRIHFLGRRSDIPAILANVDLLVHASWSEGFPNVVLEALCARLPVVATDVGGTRDLIEHSQTGLLVTPRNHSALCAAIGRVLDDLPSACRLGLNGRALIEREFSIERATRRVEAAYRRVLKLRDMAESRDDQRLVA
jgi:glycosyltransferase involved in cell wall biosynthesis